VQQQILLWFGIVCNGANLVSLWITYESAPDAVKQLVAAKFSLGLGIACALLYVIVAVLLVRNKKPQKPEEDNKSALDTSRIEEPVDRQREAQLKLVPLMQWENDLDGQLTSAHVLAELLEVHCESNEWVKQIIALLREAKYETDAEVILQAGGAPPSADQMASFEAWKRYEVARFSLCRETLAQIREKRRL
jgi:hypothetical protein